MMRFNIWMLVFCGVCFGARVDEVVPFAAKPFALEDVQLLDGPFKHAQDLQGEWLLALEPDRLLAWFRKEAGLTPKAPVYGGWENRGVAGHCLGHYLSGCSLMFQSTGDSRFLDRVNIVVSELALCQAANGNGYLAAIPGGKAVFQQVARGEIRSAGFDLNGSWVPLYTLHKLFAGLVDAYRLCGNEQALVVNQTLADWLERTLRNLNHDQMQKILACEHGGMNEALADLYADTGQRRYLILSRRFHHETVLDPLVRREDRLNGLHANTQVPKLIGLARRYELTGDIQDRTGAEFFWDRVVNHHSYCTGGHCLNEHFGEPDRLNDRLGVNTTETCNVYNMLKLTHHLFQWDAEAQTADFYECALYNQILSSHHPGDGRVVYNLTLEMGGFKRYQTKFDSFTCCVGSGMENHAKYGSDIYFHSDDALFVNLFIASKLTWQDKGLTLTQETAFPDTPRTTLVVNCDQPVALALRIRRPYWIKRGFAVTVNGESVAVTSTPSSYAVIQRTWKDGDRVVVSLPMSLHTHPMPDNPDRVAVMFGPLVLAGDLGPENNPAADRPNFVPVFVPGDRDLREWIKPVPDQPCTFKTVNAGKPHDVVFKPFFRVHGRRYSVYW
ncbi:MAG: glycoside hydrolase family 127 protein, partial [Phycisphaeraceae bacterium]|nr:glycoside hydrolase family 127 protein [Phycisphaeraceae bacterium]